MSKHLTLQLHLQEEAVTCDFASSFIPIPRGRRPNPITDYFESTSTLVRKIIDTKYADDSEVLGLLVLGVISSAEFYFRNILGAVSELCPICVTHTESIEVMSGAAVVYADAGYALSMASLEHESLADSKRLIAQIARFSNLKISENSSVKKALDDFELLCELRHCFVHAKGFVGIKAARALGGQRRIAKVIVKRDQALDFIKLAHNAVRAVNHFLGNELLNRWIDKDVLVGEWSNDRKLFLPYWALFAKTGEDQFDGSPNKAYSKLRPLLRRRRQAMAARVAGQGGAV